MVAPLPTVAIWVHVPPEVGVLSILKPYSVVELSFQVKSISLEETAVAARFDGAAGATGLPAHALVARTNIVAAEVTRRIPPVAAEVRRRTFPVKKCWARDFATTGAATDRTSLYFNLTFLPRNLFCQGGPHVSPPWPARISYAHAKCVRALVNKITETVETLVW